MGKRICPNSGTCPRAPRGRSRTARSPARDGLEQAVGDAPAIVDHVVDPGGSIKSSGQCGRGIVDVHGRSRVRRALICRAGAVQHP